MTKQVNETAAMKKARKHKEAVERNARTPEQDRKKNRKPNFKGK